MRGCNAAFVGCDVGDRFTEVCVLDQAGAVLESKRVRTTKPALLHLLSKYKRARVVLEAGTHSRWIEEALRSDHDVVVANPRQIQLIWGRRKKTDRTDAVLLARLARVDLTLVAPVHQRSRQAQANLAVLKSRDVLVTTRTRLINHVRGVLKQFGVRIESCKASAFASRVPESIPADLRPALNPILGTLDTLTDQIADHDNRILLLLDASHTAQRLAEVDGVGPITSLAYTLTIEDPAKFKRSRVVGAYVGLSPAKDQSGESDPQKHISKAGNPFIRRLLVQCAHRILGPFGRDCDLRRWGLRLCERGGAAARKRAIAAVARKLAVVMHRIWVTGEPYDPNFSRAAT